MSRPAGGRGGSSDRLLSGLGLLAVLTVSAWLVWNAWQGPPSTYWLKVTGGRLPGTKQRLAETLAEASKGAGVFLTTSVCPGSIQALEMVNKGGGQEGGLDLALVQGGLNSKLWPEVRQVAELHLEPLQLVVRGDLVDAVGAGNLRALQGRRINVGEPGSGTEALARVVLEYDGLRPGRPGALGDGEYDLMHLSHKQLQDITDQKNLPDAAFTVSALPTAAVEHLVNLGYRLVPLPFCEALALQGLLRADMLVDRVHLQETQIPAFTYGHEPAVPATPLPTIGTRIIVVANKKVPVEAVKRLLGVIYLTDFAEVARPPLDPALLDLPPEFPLHPGTEKFKQRNKPLIWGDAVDSLEKTASLLGVIITGLFFIWQWALRRYRRRRELGFESYLLKVTAIEREALQLELASRLELAPLLALQGDLGRIKAEALERFTLGKLEGEGLMSGFLTHANDARDYLARLILHARTTIEKQARRQGLSPQAAWELAIGGAEFLDERLGAFPEGHDHPLSPAEGPG
jgi:TRAP-type uncharacterized transport system substrate-binding protein